MSKKVLAIDLDEVIRSKWLQFDRFYRLEFSDEGVTLPFDTYNLRNHYDFKDTVVNQNYLNEELPDDISPKEYIIDENGNAPVDFMAFRKKDESFTADQVFNKFLYDDYLIDIFGGAPALYRGLDLDLRKFKLAFHEDVEIVLFSTEKNDSISPTLFFLSKLRPIIRRFYFPENSADIWKEADIVITTDPAIISSKGDKKVVILSRQHNANLEGDLVALNLVDLIDNVDFKNLIKGNFIENVILAIKN